MTEWIERLLAKLDRARQADPEFLAYGADRHWYRLGPRAAPDWLGWVEGKYGIELPDQYRRFLLEAGNGGAGPHNGLERFGFLDSAQQAPSALWTPILRKHTYPSGLVRRWQEQYLPDGTPTDGFEVTFYDSMRMLVGAGDILARPFPFTDPKYTNEQVEAALPGWPGNAERAEPWSVPGALYLALYGCGATQMLVLNGPWRGSVWMQDLPNDGGYHVAAESFEEWYDRWLDAVLRFCADSLNYRRLLSMFATNDHADARTVEAMLRERGIRCEVEQKGPTTIVLVDKDRAAEAKPLIDAHSERKRTG